MTEILAHMPDLLDELNPEQRAAAEAIEGPLLILAGAGSGKTRVITYRIAHLIESHQVPPQNILAVTFTNKAAAQMKERVNALLERRGIKLDRQPWLSTFHSFAVRVLRRNIDRLAVESASGAPLPRYSRDFTIYDDDDQTRLVKLSIKELGLAEQFTAPRQVLSKISSAKNRGIAPVEMHRDAKDADAAKIAQIYDLYERKLKQANALDFDDLLLKTVGLLESVRDVREWYNNHLRYILVDEYQDTNRVQYDLIRLLTLSHQNLCVVGDEDQSIYGWRGATIENILNFEHDYPKARVLRLERNYRSTQNILDAAGAVVANNQARKGKTLWTDRGRGQKIALYAAATAEEEALFVAGQILSAGEDDADASIAVLYRTNAQSRLMEEAMRRRGIKYRMVGGFSFYARAEVKDAIAYARFASNLRDSASLLRILNVPARGIGDSTVGVLEELARRQRLTVWEAIEQEVAEKRLPTRALKALEGFHALMLELERDRNELSIAGFFRSILDRSGYFRTLEQEDSPESEGRIENLRELVNAADAAQKQGETLATFLDRAALVSDADDYDEAARVTLMTLHTAKGLEFDTVYLAGLEEGLFPHKLVGTCLEDIEEERRLCYVGMTRAKRRLIVSWALQRRSFARDGSDETRPSRFLDEIPTNLIESLGSGSPAISKPRTSWDGALNSPERVASFLAGRGAGTFSGLGSAGYGQPGYDLPASSSPHARSASGLNFAPRSARGRWARGSQVRHFKYGVGTVLDCEGEGDDAKLTVSFPGYGRKKLIERFADLKKA